MTTESKFLIGVDKTLFAKNEFPLRSPKPANVQIVTVSERNFLDGLLHDFSVLFTANRVVAHQISHCQGLCTGFVIVHCERPTTSLGELKLAKYIVDISGAGVDGRRDLIRMHAVPTLSLERYHVLEETLDVDEGEQGKGREWRQYGFGFGAGLRM